MAQTSREIVQNGVATFFGGTNFDQGSRSYRGSIPSALSSAGLSVVRAHQPKRVNDNDYVLAQAAGRGMGTYLVVEVPDDFDFPRTLRGPLGGPVGRRQVNYRVVLHAFHLAHKSHMEDAEADVNGVVQALKDYINTDPSIGGIGFQAGQSRYGIRTKVPPSVLADKEITATHAEISFEVQVMYVG